jgi:UDP-N-acetylmuramoyl-tripeptide--D-alanyl-D-alanine ligase
MFFCWKRFLPVTKIEREHFHFYETFDSFSNDFKQHQFQNKIILIKGSRGMALERSLELI